MEALPALVRISFKRDRFGLYWVETVDDRQENLVVIIMDVVGNHGPSAVNGIEMIAEQLTGRLPTSRPIRWVTGCEPALDALDRDEFVEARLLPDSGGVAWTHHSRGDLEGGLVRPLTALPEDLLERVLANGGELDEVPTYTYRIVDVASLPLAHNLFRCKFADRFAAEIEEELDESTAGAVRFYAWLTGDQTSQCRYHRVDWVAIADASVAILEQLGCQPDDAELTTAINGAGVREPERAMLASLFGYDAIAISSDQTYQNGQHRGCGLRLSGAARVVIAAD